MAASLDNLAPFLLQRSIMFKTESVQAMYKETVLLWLPTGLLANRLVTFLFECKF